MKTGALEAESVSESGLVPGAAVSGSGSVAKHRGYSAGSKTYYKYSWLFKKTKQEGFHFPPPAGGIEGGG